MKRLLRRIAILVWIGVSLTGLSSCSKKQGESGKSDLSEAGYQFTPEEWFRASRENDAIALKKFISAGFQPDLKNPDGDSALHVAASAGAQNSAKFLLNRGLPVDVRGGKDRTPLMSAVIANQTAMVGWLLRQGADPRAKDKEGFVPLMLAVREGSSGSVAELAPYNRDGLDAALLLAAVLGRADVIDSLTNYGASVYARMEDGRTPLMIAAENGNNDAVKLLIDLGASRYAVDPNGHTALDLAKDAGHEDIVALISKEPLPSELVLESPEKLAEKMDSYVENARVDRPAEEPAGERDGTTKSTSVAQRAVFPSHPSAVKRSPSRPLQGEVLSNPVSRDVSSAADQKSAGASAGASAGVPSNAPQSFAMPPLIMRSYRERELPINIESVQGDTATIRIAGAQPKQLKVRVGETIPGSRLSVVSVKRRMEDSKVSQGQKIEISVVDVRDNSTGSTREWTSGISPEAHDPVALVEDSATGKRYLATQGQRFKGADGSEYVVSDVRPNQLLIEVVASGSIQTIPLLGPRG